MFQAQFMVIYVRIYIFPYITDPNTTVQNTTCKDRDLRLNDGANVREGRVEVCYNQAWGTICGGNVFGSSSATIFCAQLGFRRTLI